MAFLQPKETWSSGAALPLHSEGRAPQPVRRDTWAIRLLFVVRQGCGLMEEAALHVCTPFVQFIHLLRRDLWQWAILDFLFIYYAFTMGRVFLLSFLLP